MHGYASRCFLLSLGFYILLVPDPQKSSSYSCKRVFLQSHPAFPKLLPGEEVPSQGPRRTTTGSHQVFPLNISSSTALWAWRNHQPSATFVTGLSCTSWNGWAFYHRLPWAQDQSTYDIFYRVIDSHMFHSKVKNGILNFLLNQGIK